ncbi:urease accessory UreF family protein [Tabrizicola sp.]|uniref:urease accessory protein UreF n=1 Tax=Tabrizicola sp. TaxID=2005166 RepID=UPI00286B8AF1|nr:urease accessory UreF family protein [Tabrizicola sp.]
MRTDLLTLVQWLSPAFPTGGYAYSHGMEWAMAEGMRTPEGVANWIGDVLRFGSGVADAVLLALALKPGADHAALDGVARALATSRERLEETLAQGTAFARTVAALTGRDLPARALPVAVGEAAGVLRLEPGDVIGVYLHGFAGNLVSVATRFVPLGQTEGQRVLAGLHPVIGEVAARAQGMALEDVGTAAFGADLAAMRHEGMDVRIFKT